MYAIIPCCILTFKHFYLTFWVYLLILYVRAPVMVHVSMCMVHVSEDNFQESALFFLNVAPGDGTKVMRLAANIFTL